MNTGYSTWITSAIHPMSDIETTSRIEPALIDEPSSAIADVVADLTAAVSILGKFLHPLTAANLADAVRIMNTYYSNLIEGHNTRPRDIERALSGESKRRRMSECRQKSTECFSRVPCPPRHPLDLFSGFTTSFIGMLPPRCSPLRTNHGKS